MKTLLIILMIAFTLPTIFMIFLRESVYHMIPFKKTIKKLIRLLVIMIAGIIIYVLYTKGKIKLF